MPARTNQDESAWFYHSPFVSSKSEKPTPKPLMSQIPGINGCQDDKEAGSSRPYYKDTDTKYVRLAKQGGRRDLLNYQEFDKRKDAVAYPRVDWFYLEDNALEDAKKKKDMNWTFGVPDYMSQSANRSREAGDQKDEPQKLEASKTAVNGQTKADSITGPHTGQQLTNPSILGNQTMGSDRETGQMFPNKTVKLPEIKNDRSQKISLISSPNYMDRARAGAPDPQFKNPITQKDSCNSQPAGLNRKQGSNYEGSEVSMSKLLSHSYAKEWHDQLKDIQTGSKRAPSHIAQELNFHAESNKNQSTNRAPANLDSVAANNEVAQNSEDPKKATINN